MQPLVMILQITSPISAPNEVGNQVDFGSAPGAASTDARGTTSLQAEAGSTGSIGVEVG